MFVLIFWLVTNFKYIFLKLDFNCILELEVCPIVKKRKSVKIFHDYLMTVGNILFCVQCNAKQCNAVISCEASYTIFVC